MKILDFNVIDEPPGGNRCLATFDLELTPDCRLYGLRLLQMRDGRLLTFAPQSGARRVATFATSLAEKITNLAIDQHKAVTADDRNAA